MPAQPPAHVAAGVVPPRSTPGGTLRHSFGASAPGPAHTLPERRGDCPRGRLTEVGADKSSPHQRRLREPRHTVGLQGTPRSMGMGRRPVFLAQPLRRLPR